MVLNECATSMPSVTQGGGCEGGIWRGVLGKKATHCKKAVCACRRLHPVVLCKHLHASRFFWHLFTVSGDSLPSLRPLETSLICDTFLAGSIEVQ